eukprot:scaffold47725_cov28-Tisochrysis_lutea.AAC.5
MAHIGAGTTAATPRHVQLGLAAAMYAAMHLRPRLDCATVKACTYSLEGVVGLQTPLRLVACSHPRIRWRCSHLFLLGHPVLHHSRGSVTVSAPNISTSPSICFVRYFSQQSHV